MLLPARTKPAASHQVSAVHTHCHCWERSARAVPVLVVAGDFLPGGEVLPSLVALGMKCWAMTLLDFIQSRLESKPRCPLLPSAGTDSAQGSGQGRWRCRLPAGQGHVFLHTPSLAKTLLSVGVGPLRGRGSCPAAGVMEVPRRSRLLLACLSSQLGFSVAF